MSQQLGQGPAPSVMTGRMSTHSRPSLRLEQGRLGSAGLRGHHGCHTFRELVHSVAVYQVAEGICYRGLLPVPKKEKTALDHSAKVSEGPGLGLTTSPAPPIGLHTQ